LPRRRERSCESLAASLTPPLRLSSALSCHDEDENRDERERKRDKEKEKVSRLLKLDRRKLKAAKDEQTVKCETKKERTNWAMGKAKLRVHPRGTGKNKLTEATSCLANEPSRIVFRRSLFRCVTWFFPRISSNRRPRSYNCNAYN